jgi:hypothetical protein
MSTPSDASREEAGLDRAWRELRDVGAPGAHVRAAILARAAHAAESARRVPGAARFDTAAPAANDARWKLRAVAAVAVLGLVGLIAQQALRLHQRDAAALPGGTPAAGSAASLATESAPVTAAAPRAVASAAQPPPAAVAPARPAAAAPAALPTPPPQRPAADAFQSAERAGAATAEVAAANGPAPQGGVARSEGALRQADAGESWARTSEALLRALLARRGAGPAAAQVHCGAAACELTGSAPLLRQLAQSPELAGRLRTVSVVPVATGGDTVRYTLARVSPR